MPRSPLADQRNLAGQYSFHATHIDASSCWQILEKLGMKEWVEQHPDGLHMHIENQGCNLSSGQKQGVSICRALAGNPELILLDEPTVCLDQFMEKRLIQYLQQLGENTILVFTTHKLGLLACANSLVLMNQGQIHAEGQKINVLHAASALAKSREPSVEVKP